MLYLYTDQCRSTDCPCNCRNKVYKRHFANSIVLGFPTCLLTQSQSEQHFRRPPFLQALSFEGVQCCCCSSQSFIPGVLMHWPSKHISHFSQFSCESHLALQDLQVKEMAPKLPPKYFYWLTFHRYYCKCRIRVEMRKWKQKIGQHQNWHKLHLNHNHNYSDKIHKFFDKIQAFKC